MAGRVSAATDSDGMIDAVVSVLMHSVTVVVEYAMHFKPPSGWSIVMVAIASVI